MKSLKRIVSLLFTIALVILWITTAMAESATNTDLEATETVTIMKEMRFSLYTYDVNKTIDNLNRIAKENGFLSTWQSTGIAESGDKGAATIMLVIPAENAESFLRAVSASETVSRVHKEYAEVSADEASMTDLRISGLEEYRGISFLLAYGSPGTTKVTILLHIKRTAEENRALQQERENAQKTENTAQWIFYGIIIVGSVVSAIIRAKRR